MLGLRPIEVPDAGVISSMHPWRRQPGDALRAVIESLKLPSTQDIKSLLSEVGELQKAIDAKVLQEAYDDALRIAEAALAKAREAGNKKEHGTALYLSLHVKVLQEDREVVEALPSLLRDVATLYREADAKQEEEGVLKDIMSFQLARGDKSKASAVEQEIRERFSRIPTEAPGLLLRVAAVYFSSGDCASLQKLAQEALKLFTEQADKAGQVLSLMASAVGFLSQQKLQEAIEAIQTAMQLTDDRRQRANLQYAIAQIHVSIDTGLADAAAALQKARNMMREAGDKAGEVEILQILSELQLSRQQASEAVATGREAVTAAAGNPKMEAKALQLLVTVNLARSNEAEALRAAEEALLKAKEAKDESAEATAMGSVAELLLRRGDKSTAATKARELLALSRSREHRAGEASAMVVLGNALLADQPQSVEGLRYLQDSLLIYEKLGDISGTQSSHFSLSNCFFQRGDLEDGLRHAREVLAICRRAGDRINEGFIQQNIERARQIAADMRRTQPKRPSVESAGLVSADAGPLVCGLKGSRVPGSLLEIAAAGRKYWGVPRQVDDPVAEMEERPPSHCVIWGHSMADNSPSQNCLDLMMLVGAMAKGEIAKIPIIVQTCGVYGRGCGDIAPGSMSMVSAVTIWGMIRTCRTEMPQVPILTLDFAPGMTCQQIPRMLKPPIGVAESCYYNNSRWESQIAAVPSLFRRDLKRDNLAGKTNINSQDGKKQQASKFVRKPFSWVGPSVKLDYCWFRQEWRNVGPAEGEIIAAVPPLPVKPLRKY